MGFCLHGRLHSGAVGKRSDGFSIVEVMVATAVVGIGFSAIMSVNSQVLRLGKDTRHTNAASLMLQARMEQMRNVSWDNMTEASFLKQGVLSEEPPSGSGIPGSEVRIQVSAYNPASATPSSSIDPIIVERAADGTLTIEQAGGDFDGTRLARVDVAVTWPGSNGRQRRRASSTVISNNGISKNYVPVNGAFAGGVFDGDEDAPILIPISDTTVPEGTTGNGNGNGSGNNSGNGNGYGNDGIHGNAGNGAGNGGIK